MGSCNFVKLLLERELGGGVVSGCGAQRKDVGNTQKRLHEWATRDSLRHCASECCSLGGGHPKSTIAVAISRDGNVSASTHGDHTVKIINFNSGKFIRSLEGHHRTPWTVRFHPINSSLVVSGSLDYEVKVWDVDTGECLQSKNFGRPISSLCFHASGEMLAVAAGHKLHLWEYNNETGRFGQSSVILKTSKTIRTVHFHPLGAPMIMTTERIEPKPVQEATEAPATSWHTRAPSDIPRNTSPWYAGDQPSAEGNNPQGMAAQSALLFGYSYPGAVFGPNNSPSHDMLNLGSQGSQGSARPHAQSSQDLNRWGPRRPANYQYPRGAAYPGTHPHPPLSIPGQYSNLDPGLSHVVYPGIPGVIPAAASQGGSWSENSQGDRSIDDGLMSSSVIMSLARQFGSRGAGDQSYHHHRGRRYSTDMDNGLMRMGRQQGHWRHSVEDFTLPRPDVWHHHTLSLNPNQGYPIDPLFVQPPSWPPSEGLPRPGHGHARQRTRHGSYGGHVNQGVGIGQVHNMAEMPLLNSRLHGLSPGAASLPLTNVPLVNVPYNSIELQRTAGASEVAVINHTMLSRIGQIFASLPGFNSQELPCTTRLTLWRFEKDKPHQSLDQSVLKIPGTVLCSEMGAHMSPCGRLLAICTAVLESVPSFGSDSLHYSYELKLISLECETFGDVIRSRAISAGHCLTSVQFSPGSDLILLSYGRMHRSLVRELVSNGQTIGQIHTLLEVYKASDLALVRVLHSDQDEANTACFHPYAGEGIMYGTKGGKLRILRHTRSTSSDGDDADSSKFEDELLEVDELEDSTALGIEGN